MEFENEADAEDAVAALNGARTLPSGTHLLSCESCANSISLLRCTTVKQPRAFATDPVDTLCSLRMHAAPCVLITALCRHAHALLSEQPSCMPSEPRVLTGCADRQAALRAEHNGWRVEKAKPRREGGGRGGFDRGGGGGSYGDRGGGGTAKFLPVHTPPVMLRPALRGPFKAMISFLELTMDASLTRSLTAFTDESWKYIERNLHTVVCFECCLEASARRMASASTA